MSELTCTDENISSSVFNIWPPATGKIFAVVTKGGF